MATSEHYDVLVIGRSFAGLITAALLTKRRFRVRVLDLETPIEQPKLPLFGLNTSPVWPKILDELGLVHAMRTQGAETRGLGIALKDRRFILHADKSRRGIELAECFPGETEGLLSLFECAARMGPILTPLLEGELDGPPIGFGSKRRWQKICDLHQLSAPESPKALDYPVVNELFTAAMALSGQFNVSPDTATLSQWRTFWHLCHGETVFDGGPEKFEELLINKLESSGGVFESRKTVKEIEVRRRKIRGVHLSEGGFVGADTYILAHGEASLGSIVSDFATEQDLLYWVSGHFRSSSTVERAPCVGWAVTDVGAVATRAFHDEYWLGTTSTDPALSPEALFGSLHRRRLATGQTPTFSTSRLDEFGIYHAAADASFKNALAVGDWVIPGLGIEGDALTAWQAANIITKGATSFWKSGPKR